MIHATIHQAGKKIVTRSYKFLTVKDIHEEMRKQFGRPLSNTHCQKNGKLLVNWEFKEAVVQLEGEVNVHLGYRTPKGGK